MLGFVLDLDPFPCHPNQCILLAFFFFTDALEPWLALCAYAVKIFPGATHHTAVTPATWVSLCSQASALALGPHQVGSSRKALLSASSKAQCLMRGIDANAVARRAHGLKHAGTWSEQWLPACSRFSQKAFL